jgi:hypothetical protein
LAADDFPLRGGCGKRSCLTAGKDDTRNRSHLISRPFVFRVYVGTSATQAANGLVPGIHVFAAMCKKDVDGRDKPGHDEEY